MRFLISVPDFVKAIREAAVEEIASTVGFTKSVAERVKEFV